MSKKSIWNYPVGTTGVGEFQFNHDKNIQNWYTADFKILKNNSEEITLSFPNHLPKNGWWVWRKTQNDCLCSKLTFINKGEDMVTKVKDEVVSFYNNNKNTIITIMILFILDHFFFEGKFKEKFTSMLEAGIEKVKNSLNSTTKETPHD